MKKFEQLYWGFIWALAIGLFAAVLIDGLLYIADYILFG